MSYRTTRIIQYVVWTVITFIVGYVVLWAGARHDVKLQTAMQQYEKCVLETFHTTPAEWYEVHGELPQCELE